MNTPKPVAAALTAIALALAAPMAAPVFAQEGQGTEASVSDQTLEAFVTAVNAVNDIEQSYTLAFNEAEDDTAREAVVAEANDAMMEAIDETPGITVEEYIAVLQQAQSDPALNARIVAMLEG